MKQIQFFLLIIFIIGPCLIADVKISKVLHQDVYQFDHGSVKKLNGMQTIGKYNIPQEFSENKIVSEQYVIRFSSKDINLENSIVKLHYQTMNSSEVFTLELGLDSPKMRKVIIRRSEDDFKKNGAAKAWKITIEKEEKILGEKQSRFWSA